MRLCHRLHMCTSNFHAPVAVLGSRLLTWITQKSNIASKTSSGSTSIGVTPATRGIESANICGRRFHNERHTLTSHCSLHLMVILCYQWAAEWQFIWVGGSAWFHLLGARKWWRGNGGAGVCCGDLMSGTLPSRAILNIVSYWICGASDCPLTYRWEEWVTSHQWVGSRPEGHVEFLTFPVSYCHLLLFTVVIQSSHIDHPILQLFQSLNTQNVSPRMHPYHWQPQSCLTQATKCTHRVETSTRQVSTFLNVIVPDKHVLS